MLQNLSIKLQRSSVWETAKKMSIHLLRSAVVWTLCLLLRKLSIHLQRSAVWDQNVKGVRKLSIHLQRSAVWGLTPKVVHTTAEVGSLSYTSIVPIFLYSENCPYTCRGLQFCFKTWKCCRYSENCPYTCRRLQFEELSIHLQSSAVWTTFFFVAQTAEVCRCMDNFSNCHIWQGIPSVYIFELKSSTFIF